MFRFVAIGVDSRYRGLFGKIKYAFTFYTLIDIISILPFFISTQALPYIRVLRFLRLLKLFRFKKYLYKLINFEVFVTSNILTQLFILFFISIAIVFLFHFTYKETSLSLAIFLDPPALAETDNLKELIFGIVELVLGLIIGGTLISIITETIAQKADDIKKGFTKYRFKDHIIILHQNPKLEFILYELNEYYKSISYMQEIVIFLPHYDNIEYFSNNLKEYSNIEIKVTTGETYNWESFERISINSAKKMLILEDESSNELHKNIKISRFITSNENFKNYSLEFVIDSNSNLTTQKEIYGFCFKQRDYSVISYQKVVEMFLNRSIVNIDYFKIFSELLSFDGAEFYILKAGELIEDRVTFEELNTALDSVVVAGVIKNQTYLLNPKKDTIIEIDDKIIYIANEKDDIFLFENKPKIKTKELNLPRPKLKVDKKICIVGDFNDIEIDHINQFLTSTSIQNTTCIVKDEYMNKCLWQEIERQNYDLIILNLEDEYEFLLSLYLKAIFINNQNFFNKIVNILNNPHIAMLLEDKKEHFNIILSDRLVGQFIAQTIIHKEVQKIYDEITHTYGNEFYVLSKKEYPELFRLNYDQLKKTLLQNDMIYIGTIDNKKDFIFNSKDLRKALKIVVLTEGIE